MNKCFLIILIFFVHGFTFGTDLEDIDFYRSLDRKELVLVIHLLEREKYLSQDGNISTYVGLAKEALAERDIRVLQDDKVGDLQHAESLRRPDSYSSAKLALNVTEALNILVYCDSEDRFLKTLDGRNVGFQNGNFVILDSFHVKSYGDAPSEHTTIEIYKESILNPNFNRFESDKDGPFVYISEFDKKVYLGDISSLSRMELLFLFYELFPIAKLKSTKDWYDFGFSSILKEIKKAYNVETNSRRIK
ncbi:hypothetical protein LKV13_02695 [Borrelia sp. BU AG58]|uniref:hypothetical protein n=1 Tax=Borrelia sp. BU AG58 TaxID=2887345 RepID=UPI001E31AFED|nr:hypothetical protein [Borrelia sp. BU AG58]UER67697.1 hypothetical protein LKV13_02695 [Borrelia sp. BU AG58]